MAASPAPSVRQLVTRPTPKVSDLLFHELKDSRLADGMAPPEYGTAHPDTRKYPNYKLVFIEPADNGGWMKWWYAKDRDSQDDYNYAVTYPYGGDESFPRYTRTYVIPRDDYDPLTLGTPDPVFTDAKLVAQKMSPIEGPIGSLYVEVTRVYDLLPGTGDTNGTGTTQSDGGYVVERPLGTDGYYKVTWTLTLPKAIAESTTATGRDDYRACPIPGYTDLTLVDERLKSSDEENQTMTVVRVYIKQQTTPKEDRTRLTPHLEPPDQFADFIQRKRQNLIITAEATDDPDLWDATIPSGQEVVLESKVGMATLLQGEKDTVISQFEYGQLDSRQWDDNLNGHLTISQIPVPRADLSTWLANPSNIGTNDFYETRPLNRGWTIVTRTTMPAGSLMSPAVDYYTTKVHAWPRVLRAINVYNVVTRVRNGEGAYTASRSDIEYKEPFSGICRARVRRWWQKAAYTTEAIEFLSPTGLSIDWPILQLDMLECLHDDISFTGTTGTEHPDYGYIVFSKFLEATRVRSASNPSGTKAIDWPTSMIVDLDVVPYRGGYMVSQVDVFRPY